jgi:hypothetical protein
LFLLSLLDSWDVHFNPVKQSNDVDRDRVQRNQKLAYFALAGLCAAVVIVAFDGQGILRHVGFQNYWIDVFLTIIILMGGAERLAELLKTPAAPGVSAAHEEPPIRITGTVELKDPKQVLTGHGA